MAIYVAEAYLSRARASEFQGLTRRLERAVLIRHLFSCFIPDEETALHVLEASSEDVVRDALARAGLSVDRIVGAGPVYPSDPT